MKTKQELKERQDKLLLVYEQVKTILMKIPGVLGVGIGIKEKNEELTDDIAFRVYVIEKKDLSDIPVENRIPREVLGFKTDVIKVYEPKPRAFVERRNTSNYRPIKGGIAIGTEKSGRSYGTLGWFATKDADDTVVLLTNQHVLYGHGEVNDNKVAQPFYSKSCCCEYDVIGTNIVGINNATVDCAIAHINSDVTKQLIINNSSSTESLRVEGTDQAIVGENVWKIGARSGYTAGVVIDIGAVTVPAGTPTDPAGNPVTIIPSQILIRPTGTETYENENGKKAFSNYGDSGSVILDVENKVVGLLYSGDENNYSVDITFANNINNVLTALSGAGHSITLFTSPPGGGGRRDFADTNTTLIEKSKAKIKEFPALEPLLEDESGYVFLHLFHQHRHEILQLIHSVRVVGVTWQRYHGPAFTVHIMNSAKDPSYKIPPTVKGISLQTLLIKMGAALKENGSTALQQDINQYGLDIINHAENIESVQTLVKKFKTPAIA